MKIPTPARNYDAVQRAAVRAEAMKEMAELCEDLAARHFKGHGEVDRRQRRAARRCAQAIMDRAREEAAVCE